MRFGQYDCSHDMGLSYYCMNSWHAVTNTQLCACGNLCGAVLSSLLFLITSTWWPMDVLQSYTHITVEKYTF